jgi:hypothetical protein
MSLRCFLKKTKVRTKSPKTEIEDIIKNALFAVWSRGCIKIRLGCIGPYFPENTNVFSKNINAVKTVRNVMLFLTLSENRQ